MKNYAHFLVVFGLVGLFSGFSVFAQVKPSTLPSETISLEFANTIEREMTSGQKHIYKIKLNAGQFAKFEADQRGCDVVFSFISPEGINLLEFKNETEGDGIEVAKVAVETSGEYELRVYSFHGTNQKGTYSLKIAELRSATAKELNFTSGMGIFNENYTRTGNGSVTAEEIRKGIEKYQQALEKFRLAESRKDEALVLNNIGVLYDRLGNRDKANEYQTMAAEILQAIGNREVTALVLNNLGERHLDMGEPQKALEMLLKSSSLYRKASDIDAAVGEAQSYINIGNVYVRIGDKNRAMNYYTQALEKSHGGLDQKYEALSLNNIGRLHSQSGEMQTALEFFQKAYEISRIIKNKRFEAAFLNNLGRSYFTLGEQTKSFETLNQSLELSRSLEDKIGEAATLKNLGQMYLALAETDKALEHFYKALEIYNSVKDTQNLAETLLSLAKAESKKGNLEAAQAKAEEAISLIETIRSRINIADLRDSFSANLQDYYGFYVELLMMRESQEPNKNYAALALQANERARARGLLNLLAESNANIREGVDAKLLEKETELRNLLSARLENLTKVLNGKAKPEKADALKRETELIRTEFEQTQAQIRQTSPRYSALTQASTLSLKQIQTEVLDADSVLLEYALGEEKSFLWIVTKDSFQTVELPKRVEIENSARLTYDALTARNKRVKFETVEERRARIEQADADFLDHTTALSKTILAPAANLLAKKRLLIVADGALQYVPFASLIVSSSTNKGQRTKNEEHFLIESNEVINLPSASALAILRREMNGRPLAPKTLAILADPIFDTKDERFQVLEAKNELVPKFKNIALTKDKESGLAKNLKRAVRDLDFDDEDGINLPRLPFTRREADLISAFLPSNQRRKLLDFDANRNAVFDADLANYRFVHLATHSFINNKNPELSGIVFSLFDEKGKEQDGFLRVSEVFNLKLPAELVVLSGCRTGLGKEIRGEGLIGMTRGFMYAGAKRVVVSLWDVNDEGTSELMANFYREMLGNKKLSPASALRQAQISLLKDKRWQNPYFWATFTLQGEPK